ncbi:MAG: S-adenosylmethionine:tRNA ribosyltransferase-isomerase [bacterium]|nr:S-adenosylmethionine:tRNA ribosyltransferase-isomerase [bacterium]
MAIQDLFIKDYDYDLPIDKIAQTAIEPRDASKLLFYNNGNITDSNFKNLAEFIPKNAGLFYNDARVIPARIFTQNEFGAHLEIFLLKPFKTEYFQALNSQSYCLWECLIGNKKKWKNDTTLTLILNIEQYNLSMQFDWHDRDNNIVKISWNNTQFRFIELLFKIGEMPLPPYIKRPSNSNDKDRYQTIYSNTDGSVAAPTAGLHFTDAVIESLRKNNFSMNPLTLHVSAGTFLPVTVEKATEHPMHEEYFTISIDTLQQLLNTEYPIAVGTTSVRVIESLYWCAVRLTLNMEQPFIVNKLDPYELSHLNLDKTSALKTLISYLKMRQLTAINGVTSIMIMPSYRFMFVCGLITNFHQPKSTLLLLIAAFTNNNWLNIYKHALNNNYRFLSYGDSSLLLRQT